jgi:hypothetical protein
MLPLSLPIRKTGFKPNWIISPQLEEFGGLEKYIGAYPDSEADSQAWRDHLEHDKRLSLI